MQYFSYSRINQLRQKENFIKGAWIPLMDFENIGEK
jgi:hypothetical protein